nr:MAG TPA: hypothetical protein [Caudoviricetes sp.]
MGADGHFRPWSKKIGFVDICTPILLVSYFPKKAVEYGCLFYL